MLICVLMCVLLAVSPRNALLGAQNGVAMCIKSVIPALLPFMTVSSLAVRKGVFSRFERVGWAVLLTSLLGGYGVGVRAVCELYGAKSISKCDAEKMLAYANNSGPLFIIACGGIEMFKSTRVGVLLYICHAFAALLCALLFGAARLRADSIRVQKVSVSDCVRDCALSMLSICAYVVIFSALLNVLPVSLPLLTGFFEVTAGMEAAAKSFSVVTASLILGWGGVSVHCQAASICAPYGLSLKYHTAGKITAALLGAAVCVILNYFMSFASSTMSL